MQANLEPAKEVLRSFLAEIEDIKAIRKNISAPQPALSFTIKDRMPVFDASEFTPAPDSCWEKDDAYTWLYGARSYYPLMSRMGLNRPLPPFYSQPVKPLFDEWLELCLDIQNIDNYRIPAPLKSEALHAYLERLHSIVIDKKERRKIWWHSLRSFTNFLREKARRQIENLGELDIIFPEEMTIYFDYIIRKVPITLYPIDVWAAAEILQNLANFVLEGRSNSQESAAQTLGLTWVCCASGHARFMTRLELLHGLHPSSVKEGNQNDPLTSNHFLTIRTLFGKIDAPISKTLHDYLLALPKSNRQYIFGQPLRTLRRTLDRAIAACSQTKELGKITFLTLMHQSHETRGHRFRGYCDHLNNTP